MRLLFRLVALAGIMGIAVFLGRGFLPETETTVEEATPLPQVRVASRALPAGTFLDEAEAPFTDWQSDIGDGMIEHPVSVERDVIGAVIISPIAAGQPIRREYLLLPGQDGFLAAVLKPGRRAVSVAVDAVSGNAGHIFPGDKVDLILTQTLGGRDPSTRPGKRWASETILRNVRVIAVDQNLQSNLAERDAGRVARTITLEVLPPDAEKVALASGLGKLSLSLRSLLVDEVAAQQAPGAVPGADTDTMIQPDPIDRGPTWASDVSAVLRTAAEAKPAKSSAPAPPRNVRIFRGKSVDEVSQ